MTKLSVQRHLVTFSSHHTGFIGSKVSGYLDVKLTTTVKHDGHPDTRVAKIEHTQSEKSIRVTFFITTSKLFYCRHSGRSTSSCVGQEKRGLGTRNGDSTTTKVEDVVFSHFVFSQGNRGPLRRLMVFCRYDQGLRERDRSWGFKVL